MKQIKKILLLTSILLGYTITVFSQKDVYKRQVLKKQ